MIPDQSQLSSEEMLERMQMLRFKVHEKKIEEVWINLLNEGFEILLIKGWAAAQFYPKPYQREFSDLDIVVNPKHFEAVQKYLENNPSGYSIDLHKGLRRHDTLSFEEIFAASKIIRCGSVGVRVPRVEDHLRILCVHWLTDGGAYRERLRDIYYGVGNRPANFDWRRFLETVSPTRRRWIVCTIGLAHKYFGLKIEDTPIAAEALDLPKWLIRSVENEWASGVKLMPLVGIQYNSGQSGLWQFSKTILLNRHNRKDLWVQLKKRLNPNPVYATVDVEGEFDGKPRIFYQVKSFFRRLRKAGQMKDV